VSIRENEQINEYITENYQSFSDREMSESLGISIKAVKNRRHRMQLIKGSATPTAYDPDEAELAIDELTEAFQSVGDVDRVTLTKYVTTKQGSASLEPETTSNTRTTVTVKSNAWPEWVPIRQAPPLNIKPVKVTKVKRDLKTAVILPDPQIGYRFDPALGELDPFHDEKAMNVALQVVQDIQPDKIVNLGDYLDLPQYSKYTQEPLFAHSTQPAIDRGSSFLAEQRASAPDAEIVLIEGNHDKRLMDYMMRNAMAAYGLKRANAAPDDWPVLSVPYLLRLDEINVEYIEGYPAGEYYINDNLKCIHGKRTGRRGRIASTVIDDERVSTITGHNHHIEIAYKTIHQRSGLHIAFAAILGCLCRIDGAVPSVKSGLTANARPIRHYEDWQQGVGIVTYSEESNYSHIEIGHIYEGKAIGNGREYIADV
jgi:hypothetical protein